MNFDDVIRSVPEGDFLTVAGELNGHVQTDRRGLERVHEGRGIGCKNEDGEQIIDLGDAHVLAFCGTFFARRESQKVTYSSGGRRTEIDHILILIHKQALKTVKDVTVLPDEDVTTQHKSLVSDLSITLPPKQKGLAKAVVTKAKNAEMHGLYEKLEEPQAEKFALCLAEAQHRARDPRRVKSRWEEFFKGILNEEFPREHIPEAAPVEGPVHL
ncbi:unnamed protein product [Nippostrongylus brasiliensis]|uniref:Protein Abitram n=1 Tax=Nippostrongylus brasiliensis TaxID=27835 RepID=A0A0N4YUN3_NIPBR|nr:unnamed protein product [Nippostrongylus brasiliensis]